MANIDSWRSANRPSNKSLPGLLEKLNIIPRGSDKDDSALDTLSESSIDGGPSHSLPVPGARSSPHSPSGPSPTPSHSSLAVGSPYGSLSKANPISPGRRASMVQHQPSTSMGEAGSFLNRLTIVRAPSRGEHERENRRSSVSGSSSPSLSTSHGSLAHQASGGHSREHSGSFTGSPTSRMSFAFSSFGQSPGNTLLDQRMSGQHSPVHGPADDLASSFSSHAGIGPGGRSSFSGQPASSGGSGKDRGDARDLTPREVVELARSTSRGQVDAGKNHRRTSSTGHPSSALGVSAGGRHRIVPQAPTFPDRPAPEDEYEPVEFHPMEDDMMLPFDERPDEVKSLIEAERNRGLFKLLALALPASPTAEETKAADGEQPANRAEDWSFPELVRFLTETPRSIVGDKAWVVTIRKAVEGRSEPLWEKLKGLLGIDEDDDWGDDEHHLVGESSQAGGSESGRSGSVVLIEGLEEGGPQDDGGYDSDGRRTPSSDGHEFAEGMVAGGMFSPEAATSATLPGASSLGELEAIGESEEEELEGDDDDVTGTGLSKPIRQKSTDSNRTLGGGSGGLGALGGLGGLPTLITTGPSPSSSFTDPSRHGLVGSAVANAPVSGDISPFSSPTMGSGAQTPQGSSPRLGSSPLSTSMTPGGGGGSGVESRSPRRSFVGVSIVSSSSAEEYHQHHHTSSASASTAPSAAVSPSISSHDLSTSPSFPLHPPIRRRTSVTRDDLQYGGNEASDPMTERGPGNPLFPSSFSNLSLKPWSRPSMSGRPGVASKENDDGSSGSRSDASKAGNDSNNRDWAREMIGLKAGEKLSNSALTVGESEYSRSSSGQGVH